MSTRVRFLAQARVLSLLLVALLWLATSPATPVAAASDDEVTRQLLAAGDKVLGNGRQHYQDALAKYTEALVRSPASERGLYSRAQLLVMTGDRKAALADLDVMLAAAPAHQQGLALHMTLSAQEGQLDAAVADGRRLATVYAAAGKSEKAAQATVKSNKLASYAAEWRRLTTVLDAPLASHTPAGSDTARRKTYDDCVRLLHAVIQEFAVDSVDLRLRRASCALASENNQAATQEVKHVLTRDPQNLVAIALNAKALRGLGALDQARSELRRCLTIDPEYAPCARVSKLIRGQQKHIKAIEAALAAKTYETALERVAAAFGDEDGSPPYVEQLLQWRCEAYMGLRDAEKGVPVCEAALAAVGPDSAAAVNMLVRIAELHIVDDNLDKAEEVARRLKESHPRSDKAAELQHKIETLRRTGARKDYYKILGLKKSASAQNIRRAYRKLAKTLHPDQLRSKTMSDAEKEKSDQRFRDINEAKEVLLDEEKRARYDNGEDVMNPQAQAGQQGGPFYGHPFTFNRGGGGGGGFPGGGGGFPGGGGGQQFFFFRA